MPMASVTAFVSFRALKFLLVGITSCLHLEGRGFHMYLPSLNWMKVSAYTRVSVLIKLLILELQSHNLGQKVQGKYPLMPHTLPSQYCSVRSHKRQGEHQAICSGNFHPGSLAHLKMSVACTKQFSEHVKFIRIQMAFNHKISESNFAFGSLCLFYKNQNTTATKSKVEELDK